MKAAEIGFTSFRTQDPHTWYAIAVDDSLVSSWLEIVAAHCSSRKDFHLKPNQSFMICDIGGDTIVRLCYVVTSLWRDQEILDRIWRFTEF